MGSTEATGEVAYVDVETAGLHADLHPFWEVSIIVPGMTGDEVHENYEEWSWKFELTGEEMYRADPIGLSIGGFHSRHPQGNAWPHTDPYHGEAEWVPVKDRGTFARDFARLTHGNHLVGHVVSFDEERLRRFLLAHGVQPSWYYHIIDVEALAVGYLAGLNRAGILTVHPDESPLNLPWRSDEVSLACHVAPPSDEERHTGIGDARWARRLHESIVGERTIG